MVSGQCSTPCSNFQATKRCLCGGSPKMKAFMHAGRQASPPASCPSCGAASPSVCGFSLSAGTVDYRCRSCGRTGRATASAATSTAKAAPSAASQPSVAITDRLRVVYTGGSREGAERVAEAFRTVLAAIERNWWKDRARVEAHLTRVVLGSLSGRHGEYSGSGEITIDRAVADKDERYINAIVAHELAHATLHVRGEASRYTGKPAYLDETETMELAMHWGFWAHGVVYPIQW